jgi:hypothetical protein
VSEFTISGANSELQYYLTMDTNKYGLERVLFQLHGELAEMKTFPKYKKSKRIIIFISF